MLFALVNNIPMKDDNDSKTTEINETNNLFYKVAKNRVKEDKYNELKCYKLNSPTKELEFTFKCCNTDQAIIDEIKNNYKENLKIAICDPNFIEKKDQNDRNFKVNVVINRLLLWGFSDIKLLKRYILIEKDLPFEKIHQYFQSNISYSLDKIIHNIKNAHLPHNNCNSKNDTLLDIYCYSVGTTLYNEVYNEIEKKFNKNEDKKDQHDIAKYVTIKPQDKDKNITLYDPLKKNQEKPWIIFTAEPIEIFKSTTIAKKIDHQNQEFGFVSSAIPSLYDFTAIVINSPNPTINYLYEKLNDRLQDDALPYFYNTNFYRKFKKLEEGNSLDLIEWEIYKNQRIYAFDIKKEAYKWKSVFEFIVKTIKPSKDDNVEQEEMLEKNPQEATKLDPSKRENMYEKLKSELSKNESTIEAMSDKNVQEAAFLLLNTLSELYEKHQMEAKKSALGSIIARNMSHNLGSHVVNYIKHNCWVLGQVLDKNKDGNFSFDLKEIGQYTSNPSEVIIRWQDENGKYQNFLNSGLFNFFEYMNQRMEFIANVISSPPSTPITMNFNHDLVKKIIQKNNYIKDFIAKSELKQNKANLEIINENESSSPSVKDISIPDGWIGAQGFYTIIENFIRNSAKHSFRNQKDLKISIKIKDHPLTEYENDFYQVEVSDNLGNGDDVIKILKDKGVVLNVKKSNGFNENTINICPDFVSNEGEIIPSFWGIKEMFVGACYLQGIDINQFNNKKDDNILQYSVDNNGNLKCTFSLLKPKTLLIITNSENSNDTKLLNFKDRFKEKGVDCIYYDKYNDELDKGHLFIRHEFCLLYNGYNFNQEEKENLLCLNKCYQNEFDNFNKELDNYKIHWISRYENFLPYRIFCDCNHEKNNKLCQDCENHCWAKWNEQWYDEEKFEELYNNIYTAWLHKCYGEVPELLINDQRLYCKNSNIIVDETIFTSPPKQKTVLFWSHFNQKDLKQNIPESITLEDITGDNTSKALIEDYANNPILSKKFKIVEAAFPTVIIIDERIYNNCHDELYSFYWYFRDIYVYNYNADNGKFIYRVKSHSPDKLSEKETAQECRNKQWDFSFITETTNRELIDFIVIHRGIIEKILGSDNDVYVDEILYFLKKQAKYVIISSGRGKPEYIEQSWFARFVNVENLYSWFFDNKIKLVSSLMSLTNT